MNYIKAKEFKLLIEKVAVSSYVSKCLIESAKFEMLEVFGEDLVLRLQTYVA